MNALGITKEDSRIMSFTLIKSSVDISKLTLNDVLQLYSDYLSNDIGYKDKDLTDKLDYAASVYRKLKSYNKEDNADSALLDVVLEEDHIDTIEHAVLEIVGETTLEHSDLS